MGGSDDETRQRHSGGPNGAIVLASFGDGRHGKINKNL